MRLKVLAPAKAVIDAETGKIVARSPSGYFCLLQHHIDFVSELAPGLLAYRREDGGQEHLAVDEGILVKCGDEVLVATRDAIGQEEGQEMKAERALELLAPDEDETACRQMIADLEDEFVRRLER